MGMLLILKSGVQNPDPPDIAPVSAAFTGGTLAGSFSFGVTAPVTILVGPPTGAIDLDITSIVPIDSITIEESGTHDEAFANFSIIDQRRRYQFMRGEWQVLIQHGSTAVFRGFIGQPSTRVRAVFGERVVRARDFGTMLDRLIVKSRFVRAAGESDKARIQWLVDTIGQPLVKMGMTRWGKVQVLQADMPRQVFPPRLTLRQCIERVLGAASNSANYYVDMEPRLHTFDADNPEAGWTAVKNVNLTSSPAADEFAPEDFELAWDTDGMVNAYYVRGKNAKSSGWFPDRDIQPSGPFSSDLFGLRSAYIDAPDADTQAKAERVARYAMWDTMNPIPRGTYKVFVGRDDTRYEAGQLQFVASRIHGLEGSGDDRGPKAGAANLQPLRIVSVTTRYLNGNGDREQEIEFGGRRIHRYSASIG